MLKNVDRVVVAVHDLDGAEKNYQEVLAAVPFDEFVSEYLNARIRRLSLGTSEVELCMPVGAGPVDTRLHQFGEGLVCGGVTTEDLDVYAQYLDERNTRYTRSDGRLYLNNEDLYGLPLVVSPAPSSSKGRAAGPIEFLYELTMVLRSDWHQVADAYAKRLGLSPEHMVDITFPRFGYEGALMMFDPQYLDRIELSEAHDPAFPMGRFSSKHGDAFYMCYVQTDDLPEVIQRLDRHKHRWTRRTDTPQEQDGLWIHPSALNGVLMGVSRTSLAWEWSGQPERVQALE